MRKVSISEMLELAGSTVDPPGRFLLQEELSRAKPSLNVLQELLRSNPERASTGNEQGSLPLHVCAANIHSIETAVLTLILESHPGAIFSKNVFGLLPLHKAVMAPILSTAPPRLDRIEQLIELHPAALESGTKEQQLPLHLSLRAARPCESLVELLLDKYPLAVRHEDDRGQLPLHKLAAKAACEETISLFSTVLDAYPGAAVARDSLGRSPLHWVVTMRDKPNLDILGELLEAAPRAVMIEDNEGFKPLSRLMNRGQERCGASCLLLAQAEEGEVRKAREEQAKLDAKRVTSHKLGQLHKKKHFNFGAKPSLDL